MGVIGRYGIMSAQKKLRREDIEEKTAYRRRRKRSMANAPSMSRESVAGSGT